MDLLTVAEAWFYYLVDAQGGRNLCREAAFVRRRDRPDAAPQVVFVGLNPGSCSPSDPAATVPSFTANQLAACEYTPAVVAAEPDPTMRQVGRILLATGLDAALLVNVTDLKAASATELLTLLKGLEPALPIGGIHSLFHPSRLARAEQLVPLEGMPVVCCWGLDPASRRVTELADDYLSALTGPQPTGLTEGGVLATHTPGAPFLPICPALRSERPRAVCTTAHCLATGLPQGCTGCSTPFHR